MPCSGYIAMPILPEILMTLPAIKKLCWISSNIFSEMTVASAMSVCSITKRNSSPPILNNWVFSPKWDCTRFDSWISNWSPTWCPNTSFTALKRSKSIYKNAILVFFCRCSEKSNCAYSAKYKRLGNLVRLSLTAWLANSRLAKDNCLLFSSKRSSSRDTPTAAAKIRLVTKITTNRAGPCPIWKCPDWGKSAVE